MLAIGWSLTASADPGPGLTGNDTGGIITWSPQHQRMARQWAAAHCAQYGEVAHITSIHPRYGDYIGFACDWRPPYRSGGASVNDRRAYIRRIGCVTASTKPPNVNAAISRKAARKASVISA